MGQPSIRECMQRLDAVATPVADALALMGDLAKSDSKPWPEMQQAIATLRTLHQLARDLLGYVRNQGTPPVREPSPKIKAQTLALRSPVRPAHLLRPQGWDKRPIASRPAVATSPRAPAPKPADRPPLLPAGMIYIEEVSALAGLTCGGAYKAVSTGWLPKCAGKFGKRNYWPRAQIVACVAERARIRAAAKQAQPPKPQRPPPAPRPSRAKDHGPQPPGTLTTEQICERLNRTQTWIYQTLNAERDPFPQPCGDWSVPGGMRRVWSIEAVDAWVQQRNANPFKRGQRKPLGPITTGRETAINRGRP